MGPRAKEAVFVGYGETSHSYIVYVDGAVSQYRPIQRMSLSQRWSAAKVQEVEVTVADAHHQGGTYQARPVPLVDKEAAEPEAGQRTRQARRLELRQADFDPSLGGHGWSDNCPKSDKARLYGWRSSVNQQHSAACRARLEHELSRTEKGRQRLEHAKERLDRWTSEAGETIIEPTRDARPDGGVGDSSPTRRWGCRCPTAAGTTASSRTSRNS